MENGNTQAGKFKLKLVGDGISVERPVDAPTAWRILSVLMERDGTAPASPTVSETLPLQTAAPAVTEPATGRGSSSRQGSPSLREFLDQHEPGRNVEKIAAIAAYLEEHREMGSFTKEDVRKGFRDASEPVPGNYGRDFNWARSAGWIANTDNRGEYYVTKTGREAVQNNFPPDIRKASAVGKTARKRRPKSKAGKTDE
jgi:hypothetical protein